jgi:hypothetical protein
MLGKNILIFVLCSSFILVFAQDQKRRESLQNSQKHTDVLPNTQESAMTEGEQLAAVLNELSYYFNATIQFYSALKVFEQNYNVETPEVTCKYCPQRALPCDELINKTKARAMKKAIFEKTSIAEMVHKKMLAIYQEITDLLSIGNMENIRKFMAKIAQEEAIPCEGCQKVEWTDAGVISMAGLAKNFSMKCPNCGQIDWYPVSGVKPMNNMIKNL